MEAKIEKDLIPVKHAVREIMGERIEFLQIDVPNGWEDVKKICKKVLSFEGVRFTFTGWNSDGNYACFRESSQFARIV